MKRATAAVLLTAAAVAHTLESRPIAPFSANLPGADLSRRDGGNDTDQTGESVTVRFGDLRLEARP